MNQGRWWLALLALLTLWLGAAGAASAQSGDVGYGGGFYLEDDSGRYRLRINGVFQPRLRAERREQADSDAPENIAAFELTRARLAFSGYVHRRWVKYFLQVAADRGDLFLLDGWLELTFKPQSLALRAGHFIRPFSREALTPIFLVDLMDRSILQGTFGPVREVGVMLHGDGLDHAGFNWAVGLFNGVNATARLNGAVEVDPDTGVGTITSGGFTNVPRAMAPELVAWLGWNQDGAAPFHQADLQGGPLRLSASLSAAARFDSDGGDDGVIMAQADATAKVEGFSLTLAALGSTIQDGPDFTSQTARALGFQAQAGYVLMERVQPVARYTLIAPDGKDNDTQEIGLGLNIMLARHFVRWMTEFTTLQTDDPFGGQSSFAARTQLSVFF